MTRMKLTGMPGKVTLPEASVILPMEPPPSHIRESTPAPVKPMDLEPVMTSARPHRMFFMPMVDTKGWGRSRRVSRVPLMKPARVLTARPQTASSTGLVRPKFWTSTPMVQVHSTQLEPTDRSIPAVISAHSIPEAIRQLMDACFRMFMTLPIFGNLSGMVMQKMAIRITRASRVPSFCRSSFAELFFFISV